MNILVTGGTGFLGSHLVERLIELRANVFVTYRSKNSKSYFFQNGFDKKTNLLICDIKNRERVLDIISRHKPEIIFHLAAQSLVTTAYINPIETFNTNLMGTINILESSRLCNTLKAILVASSDKAYGISNNLPYGETDRLEGVYPYDVSKSCADLISKMYFITYDLPIIVTRMANMYGPGDLNFNRLIPGALTALIKNQVLDVRSDGKMIREYVYVKEIVDAYILLIEQVEKAKGESFNIGSGEKLTVLELIDKISSILKQKIQFKILNTVKAEIPAQYMSIEKIQKKTGWKPHYSLEKGILETYEWYKNNFFK